MIVKLCGTSPYCCIRYSVYRGNILQRWNKSILSSVLLMTRIRKLLRRLKKSRCCATTYRSYEIRKGKDQHDKGSRSSQKYFTRIKLLRGIVTEMSLFSWDPGLSLKLSLSLNGSVSRKYVAFVAMLVAANASEILQFCRQSTILDSVVLAKCEMGTNGSRKGFATVGKITFLRILDDLLWMYSLWRILQHICHDQLYYDVIVLSYMIFSWD